MDSIGGLTKQYTDEQKKNMILCSVQTTVNKNLLKMIASDTISQIFYWGLQKSFILLTSQANYETLLSKRT